MTWGFFLHASASWLAAGDDSQRTTNCGLPSSRIGSSPVSALRLGWPFLAPDTTSLPAESPFERTREFHRKPFHIALMAS